MSLLAIRAALEVALAGLALPTDLSWENVRFKPVVGEPYAQVFLLPAQPDNIEIGPGFIQQGILQLNLFYPKDAGAGDAIGCAELIRDAFPFGASFSASGVTVNVIATPEIAPALAEADRFMVPVRVRWSAHLVS